MPSEEKQQHVPTATRAPRGGLQLMALILLAIALLSVYSNWQKAHRDQIETVTIMTAPAPKAMPSASPEPVGQ